MRYDAIRERFNEAFENSIIFKDANTGLELDTKIVNSFIEMMQIRVFMPRDFIIKAGVTDQNFYFVLDGNAIMFGMNNNLLGILSSGTHYCTDIESAQGTEDY
jgi:hypothetical protein